MKILLFILINFIISLNLFSQNNYSQAIQQGDVEYKKGNFEKALLKYFAAEAFNPLKKEIVNSRIKEVFKSIYDLNKKLEFARKNAIKAQINANNTKKDLKEIIHLIADYTDKIENEINIKFSDTIRHLKNEIILLKFEPEKSEDLIQKNNDLFYIENEKSKKLIEAFKFTDKLASIDTLNPSLTKVILDQAILLIKSGQDLSSITKKLGIGISINHKAFEYTNNTIEILGTIVLLNSELETGKRKYISNAEIYSPGASPTLSDNFGQFKLVFQNQNLGDSIKIFVKKDGFDVINNIELEHLILDNKKTIQVILAREGELEKNKRYYNKILSTIAVMSMMDSTYLNRADKISLNLSNKKNELQNNISSILLIADFAKLQGNYKKSIELYQQAIKFDSTNFKLWYGISQAYQSIGEFNNGLNALTKCFLYIKDKSDEYKASNTLGVLYSAMGNYEKSIKSFENLIEKYKLNQNIDDPEFTKILNNLAIAYQDNAQFDKALGILKNALEIDIRIYGENHINVSRDYNNISLIYKQLGLFDEAIFHLQKALKIDESFKINTTNNTSNSNIARDYGNLASIYRQKGDYEKALQSQLQSIKINENILERSNPNLAKNYNNLALIYQGLGRYKEALEFQFKALALYNLKNEDNPYSNLSDIATLYSNIAITYSSIHKLTNAKRYVEKSINLYNKFLPEIHPNLKEALALQEKINNLIKEWDEKYK